MHDIVWVSSLFCSSSTPTILFGRRCSCQYQLLPARVRDCPRQQLTSFLLLPHDCGLRFLGLLKLRAGLGIFLFLQNETISARSLACSSRKYAALDEVSGHERETYASHTRPGLLPRKRDGIGEGLRDPYRPRLILQVLLPRLVSLVASGHDR